jgi:ABC-type Fe3+-siderophore transport system permease subunit
MRTNISQLKTERQRHLSGAGFSVLLITLIALTAAVFFTSICVGKFSVPLADVLRLFLSKIGLQVQESWDARAEGGIFTLRLPRTLGALLV